MKDTYDFNDLMDIIAMLRSETGCPWDREQTHESLKPCMIEEAYEVCEAVDIAKDTKDYSNLCEELGDVMLQVVMHSQIAKEASEFTMNDVLTGICKKMIDRHPHVFGDKTEEVMTSSEVLDQWEEIKRKEKNEETLEDQIKRVPKSFPATLRAQKIQKKASKVGYDFEDYNQVLGKVYEELKELEDAIRNADENNIDEEFGDVMFTMVNLSRFLQLNVENSLTNATNKFINRLIGVEHLAKAEQMHLRELSTGELDELWNKVK